MKPITTQQKKHLICHAIIHSGFKSMEHALKMERNGFAEFDGNQWNENWKWNIEYLLNLTHDELLELWLDINGYNK